ncbi:MAG: peptidoglycan-binding protein [Lachnospiraceae bacterium]|jgi:peptidoglycan hydrolase-like protein with peptidoglycan-binding domain|nr:peptidoglycan-binding protein [Lachnospiraceae bacterium]
MGTGLLKLEIYAGENTVPLGDATVVINDYEGNELYRLGTNEDGETDTVALWAPDKAGSLQEDYANIPYAKYDVIVQREGYQPVMLHGVEIFDTETSIQSVQMHPRLSSSRASSADEIEYIDIPDNSLLLDTSWDQEGPADGQTRASQPGATGGRPPRVLPNVVIPAHITVHLGTKNSAATNVTVPFVDYIKNVASSEIYPTWPTASLEANIRAIINFALNRIYTEWYRSQGYNFDITNSTSSDQYYKPGQTIFKSVSDVVDQVFMQYLTRSGFRDPYFTEFCNGSTVTCPGLHQWGTVTLANNGYTPMEILRNYYPRDLVIKEATSIGGTLQSYPGYNLQTGSQGNAVRVIQDQLNRIRANYPLIPPIVNRNGTYGADTAAAVRTFQGVFNLPQTGVVDRATWYKISYIYVAVTKLAELESEGERLEVGNSMPGSVIREGARGHDVVTLQYLLDYIAAFYPEVGTVVQDTIFGPKTTAAVKQFQQRFGLTADGIVGPATWAKLYEVYNSLNEAVPPTNPPQANPQYPGTLLRVGSVGSGVATMQEFLNMIGYSYPAIPKLTVDGAFGPATQTAVRAFQRQFGLSQDGIIGPQTWQRIVDVYNQTNGSTRIAPLA